jgi:hypothetical protein
MIAREIKSLKRIMKYPALARTSHGFGVHSPFAYRFITCVLEERTAQYYAYREIAARCPRRRRLHRGTTTLPTDMSAAEGKLIFRILCYFNPQRVTVAGTLNPALNFIISEAVPNAEIATTNNPTTESSEATTIPVAESSETTETTNNPGQSSQNSQISQSSQPCEPVVIVNLNPGEAVAAAVAAELQQTVAEGDAVVIMRNIAGTSSVATLWQQLTATVPHGMIFTDGKTGVFVARHKLPRMSFKVFMK